MYQQGHSGQCSGGNQSEIRASLFQKRAVVRFKDASWPLNPQKKKETQSMMEQTGEAHHNKNNSSGNELPACGLHSKRLKELENAALQTTLISRMETESGADGGSWTEQEPGEGEQSSVLSLNHRSGPPQQPGADTETEEAEPDRNVAKERVEEERTLTDHLNKRLLSSFLEKLNERDLALPGVQRLDCAVADEDSNRAADEW